MKRSILAALALQLMSAPVLADDLAVELRFESRPAEQQSQNLANTLKSLRPVRIQAFSDSRGGGDTLLGEIKVNGLPCKVLSRTAVAVYATDAFRKLFGEWGGSVSPDAPLVLSGEVTHFSLEEGDGYQARIGFHFLLKDGEGRVLWDGHSSGVVRGTGRTLTADLLPPLFNNLLRETYAELLEDDKLVGIWSGRVQNTYIIKDSAASSLSGRES